MYEKQTWKTGDVITEEKLNHMEDGIASAGSIPLYTPEVVGQNGGANYYDFFASGPTATGTQSIILIKQQDPNNLFKIPSIGENGDENIDTVCNKQIIMPIPGTWNLIGNSPIKLAGIGPVENKTVTGFYLNEVISPVNLYFYESIDGEFTFTVLFMDHIPNVEFFDALS